MRTDMYKVIVERRREEQSQIDARRRVIDDSMQLHRLGSEWYEVQFAALPPEEFREVVVRGRRVQRRVPNGRFDVVMKRAISRDSHEDAKEQGRLYGSQNVYAVSKRQLSRREKKRFGLD